MERTPQGQELQKLVNEILIELNLANILERGPVLKHLDRHFALVTAQAKADHDGIMQEAFSEQPASTESEYVSTFLQQLQAGNSQGYKSLADYLDSEKGAEHARAAVRQNGIRFAAYYAALGIQLLREAEGKGLLVRGRELSGKDDFPVFIYKPVMQNDLTSKDNQRICEARIQASLQHMISGSQFPNVRHDFAHVVDKVGGYDVNEVVKNVFERYGNHAVEDIVFSLGFIQQSFDEMKAIGKLDKLTQYQQMAMRHDTPDSFLAMMALKARDEATKQGILKVYDSKDKYLLAPVKSANANQQAA